MIDFIGIDFSLLNWQQFSSLVLVIIATGYSMSKSYKRLKLASKIYLGIILFLNLLAAIALSGFILKPTIISQQPQLIRLNTSNQQLETNQRADFRLKNDYSDTLDSSVVEISDPQQLLIQYPHVKSIEIVGDGLTESQWHDLPSMKILYKKPELKLGLVYTQWNKQLILGETLLISGEVQISKNSNLEQKKLTIRLLDPAFDTVAETEIFPDQQFTLEAQPKLAGQLQYSLQILLAGNTSTDNQLFEQSIHTNVINRSHAKILVIQSSPSFETKQLQNWAAENGAQLLVKTKISKDKYIQRTTNFPELTTTKISLNLFNQFDLVILDGREFTALSSLQQQWLTESVANGLGMLILADDSLLNMTTPSKLLTGVKLKPIDENKQASLSWLDNNYRWTLPTEFSVSTLAATIDLDKNLVANSKRLIVTELGSVKAYQYSYQFGRIGINLFNQSHQWVTSGMVGLYSSYWQNLIANIGRRTQLDQFKTIEKSQLNFKNQLMELCIIAKKPLKNVQLIFAGEKGTSSQLLLQKNNQANNTQCGYFWPENAGWYQAIVDGEENDSTWFYVEAKKDWPAHVQLQKIKATLAKQSAFQLSTIDSGTRSPISLWLFWWLLVVSATLLWIERKFLSE